MKFTYWAILLLIVLFILVPVAMLFKESLVGKRAIAEEELIEGIEDLLSRVPDEDEEIWASEWFERMSDEEKLEVYSKALREVGADETVGLEGLTLAEVEKKIDRLSYEQRESFKRAVRVVIFALNRAPFMFRVKSYTSEREFERLRSGHENILTGEHYRKVLTTSYLIGSIRRSLLIAFVSMIFTVGAAYLFAYAINRTSCRFKSFFRAMMLLPLVSPPVIMSFALIMLFGRRGIITNGLLEGVLHLVNADTFNIYGMHGIVLAQMLTYGPIAFVVLHSVLAQMDTRIEEAAKTLGASRWYTFRKVTLPMSYPGLFRAALLVFALCMQDFGNPRIIGGQISMIAGVMYDQMIGFQNTGIAAVLGTILLLPSIAAFVVGNIMLSRKTFASSEQPGVLYIDETPKATRTMFEIGCSIFSLLVLVLYLTIVWGSFVKVWGHDATLTLDYYTATGMTDASFLEADVGSRLGLPLVLGSVKIMGIAALIGGLLAVVTGYVLVRRKGVLAKLVTYLILLSVALPGVVFGIGYILTFNAPFGVSELALTGTMWIIIFLIIFTRMYGGVLPTQAVLQKVDVSVEEAAISLGATQWYAFRRVIFPVLRRPWLLGTLYIFTSGLAALGGVIFLTSAKNDLASVRIYLLAEQGKFGLACSHATYLIVVVLLAQLLIRFIERKSESRTLV
jgi:iron(III) transport system permease protein